MAYVCIILLLLGSAFFSGSEIAYTSLNKLKLKKDSENPKGVQKIVLYIFNHYDQALSTILIGNNLVNIAATSLATVLAVSLAASMEGKITDDFASGLVTVIMTVLILIFGEITPKMVARRCNESIARFAAYPLRILMILFLPAVALPSVLWAARYSRRHRRYAARGVRYTARYPEQQANRLGLRVTGDEPINW